MVPGLASVMGPGLAYNLLWPRKGQCHGVIHLGLPAKTFLSLPKVINPQQLFKRFNLTRLVETHKEHDATARITAKPKRVMGLKRVIGPGLAFALFRRIRGLNQ
jgi:hypothetical protein